jgi:citrate synthase
VTTNGRPGSDEPPEFTTAISRVTPGEVNVRGYDARDLIRNATASEAAFLTIRGRRPTPSELRVFDAILCSCVDHGLVNTLSVTGRYVMSGAASLPAAIAAGVLCFGPYTGTANLTAELLLELVEAHGETPDDAAIDSALRRRREKREPIPGLGHPVHREIDPRTTTVREVADEEGLIGPYVELLDRVRERGSELVGRELVLNVDGLMGALLLEIGFSPEEMLAANVIAAVPGIAAHAIEEAREGRRLRFPAGHEAGYTLPEQTRPWEEAGGPAETQATPTQDDPS